MRECEVEIKTNQLNNYMHVLPFCFKYNLHSTQILGHKLISIVDYQMSYNVQFKH